MKGYVDCYKCKWSHRLYDRHGKLTGAVFCSMRNSKLHKRFRGECELRERFEEHIKDVKNIVSEYKPIKVQPIETYASLYIDEKEQENE